MFDIYSFIFETLEPLDIPVYFCARKETPLPMVLFNVTGEKGVAFWDDGEVATRYKVCINIFSKGNFIKYKNQIKSLMENVGFERVDIPECIYQEDTEIFNQPMFFSYTKEK